MPVLHKSESGIRRSAVYSYLRSILIGRRILEVGCGTGESAAYLVTLGARSVISVGQSHEVAEARAHFHEGALGFVPFHGSAVEATGPFDVVLLPDADAIVQGHGGPSLASLLSLVAPTGRFICFVRSGDQDENGAGIGYYDLVDALAPRFAKVRMFGQTPFMGVGVAEFDETTAELRVETDLAVSDEESPTHYIAVAGPDEPLALGYALVQFPSNLLETTPVLSLGSGNKAPDSLLAEWRQRLSEAEGKADGLVRVSRAQSEEIEELRARLRRTAEARAELDEEVRRLRRSLIEADESVVNLTRKTTEEMTALAQRLTAGLRGDDGGRGTPDAKRHETLLAEQESALADRDERIAQLELARQEVEWRLAAAEEELTRARTSLLAQKATRESDFANLQKQLAELEDKGRKDAEDLRQARLRLEETNQRLSERERSAEEFRKAAALHLEELGRLRDESHEVASRVGELEDELADCQRHLTETTADRDELRRTLNESEASDRQRRSRLAELEGRMLRMERTAAEHLAEKDGEKIERASLEAKIKELKVQNIALLEKVAEADQGRRDALAELARQQAEKPSPSEMPTDTQKLQEQIASLTADAAYLREAANDADGLRIRLDQAVLETNQLRERLAQIEASHEIALKSLAEREKAVAEQAEILRQVEEKAHRLTELRAEAPDPEAVYERLYELEMQYQAATMSASRVPVLEARIAELETARARGSQ